jgi:hypothetical protein
MINPSTPGPAHQPLSEPAEHEKKVQCEDQSFVAGTSKRVVKSQTWAALRLRRRARMRPGWFPLCQGRDRLTEIPAAMAWS